LNDRLSRFVSLYANGAYTYLSRYTVSMSARKDGSNLFGVNTNDKWQPLWSAGLRWQLSQEKFAPLKKLLQLQLRLTYGVSGNVDLSKSAITTIGYLLNSPYTQTPQAIIDRFANPELQWEKSYMLNAGLDFSLVSNRLSGSVEFYHKKADNLFGNAPIDYTGGAGGTITKNVAAMKGDGIDLVLNGVIIQKPFKWMMQLIYSRYKDKVTDYYLTSLEGRNFISLGRPRISGLEDRPVYSIFSYAWAGLDATNGDPQGILDGTISTDYTRLTREPMVGDLTYQGPALPVHYGSIGNTFSWKNLELSVRMMYKLGYYFRRQSVEYGSLFNLRAGHQDYTKRWQKPGDELLTDVPSIRFPANSNRDAFYGGSETLVEKGDHIRLSYVSFAYNIRSGAAINQVIKNLRIYGMVNNLGVIWRANQHGIDPDMPAASILPSRSYAIGINASF
jgi:TonB-dependent starch-binding outer membrane protein SusC